MYLVDFKFEKGVSQWMNPLPDIALHTLQVDDIVVEHQEEFVDNIPHEPSPETIMKSRQNTKRVALNVGGVKHEVTWKLLEQYPNSRKIGKS